MRRLSGLQLPRQVVVEDQRRRIAAALAEAVCRRGYQRFTVRDVIEPASVSRRTFYDLYSDKVDAFRAVHAEALARLGELVDDTCAADRQWPDALRSAIETALRWAAAEPAFAYLLVGEPFTAGPHRGYCHDRLVDRFAPALRRGREGRIAALPERLEALILSGIADVVARQLRAGRVADLPALAPELSELAGAPYRGSCVERA